MHVGVASDIKWLLVQPFFLGNLYSEHLRDTITACIQTDRMARPDITQIRLKCEQMCQWCSDNSTTATRPESQ